MSNLKKRKTMKMIYQKPMTAIYNVQSLHMMAQSLNANNTDASTKGGYYDKALSKEDNFWDEWDD